MAAKFRRNCLPDFPDCTDGRFRMPLLRATWAFLIKPFDDEKFIAAVRDALSQA
jgi:hypothetical protein